MRTILFAVLALALLACEPPPTSGAGGGGGFPFAGGIGGGTTGGGTTGGGTTGGGTMGGGTTGGGTMGGGAGGGTMGGGAGGGTMGGGTGGGGSAGRASLTVPAFVFDPKVVASADGALHLTHRTQTPGAIIYGRCAADCGVSTNWDFVTLETAAFVGASRLAVGSDLRVHVVYEVSSAFTYATCASNCTSAASWSKTALSPLGSSCDSEMQNANLVLDSAGRLSFMTSDFNESQLCVTTCAGGCDVASNWQTGQVATIQGTRAAWAFAGGGTTLHLAWDDKVSGVRYASCAADCTQAASWQVAGLFFYRGGDAAIALAASPGGRVHLAYNQGTAPANAPPDVRANDGRLLSWQCAGNCGDGASWEGVALGAGGEGTNGLAVQATATGAALLAAQSDLTAHACQAGCGNPAAWGSGTLESAAELTAALPDPYSLSGCTVNGSPVPPQLATWAPEKPAFALTPGGALLAHTMVRGLRTCPGVSTPTAFPGYGRVHWVP